jgi:hypothetical protein
VTSLGVEYELLRESCARLPSVWVQRLGSVSCHVPI